MPQVIRVGKYGVLIFPDDHEPAHVHVYFARCELRVLVSEAEVVLDRISGRPKAQEIRRALNIVAANLAACLAPGRRFMETDKPKIVIPPLAVRKERQIEMDHEVAHRYAREMHYDRRRREFRFVLNSGVSITIPVAKLGYGFAELTPAQLGRVQLGTIGGHIELRELDMDMSVPGLIRDVLGFGVLQQHRAARARTEKKAASSRANGLKGGRPRKVPAAV
jgi:hypothetical protein